MDNPKKLLVNRLDHTVHLMEERMDKIEENISSISENLQATHRLYEKFADKWFINVPLGTSGSSSNVSDSCDQSYDEERLMKEWESLAFGVQTDDDSTSTSDINSCKTTDVIDGQEMLTEDLEILASGAQKDISVKQMNSINSSFTSDAGDEFCVATEMPIKDLADLVSAFKMESDVRYINKFDNLSNIMKANNSSNDKWYDGKEGFANECEKPYSGLKKFKEDYPTYINYFNSPKSDNSLEDSDTDDQSYDEERLMKEWENLAFGVQMDDDSTSASNLQKVKTDNTTYINFFNSPKSDSSLEDSDTDDQSYDEERLMKEWENLAFGVRTDDDSTSASNLQKVKKDYTTYINCFSSPKSDSSVEDDTYDPTYDEESLMKEWENLAFGVQTDDNSTSFSKINSFKTTDVVDRQERLTEDLKILALGAQKNISAKHVNSINSSFTSDASDEFFVETEMPIKDLAALMSASKMESDVRYINKFDNLSNVMKANNSSNAKWYDGKEGFANECVKLDPGLQKIREDFATYVNCLNSQLKASNDSVNKNKYDPALRDRRNDECDVNINFTNKLYSKLQRLIEEAEGANQSN